MWSTSSKVNTHLGPAPTVCIREVSALEGDEVNDWRQGRFREVFTLMRWPLRGRWLYFCMNYCMVPVGVCVGQTVAFNTEAQSISELIRNVSWQVVFSFFGTLSFFSVEWKGRQHSDYSPISWELQQIYFPPPPPGVSGDSLEMATGLCFNQSFLELGLRFIVKISILAQSALEWEK